MFTLKITMNLHLKSQHLDSSVNSFKKFQKILNSNFLDCKACFCHNITVRIGIHTTLNFSVNFKTNFQFLLLLYKYHKQTSLKQQNYSLKMSQWSRVTTNRLLSRLGCSWTKNRKKKRDVAIFQPDAIYAVCKFEVNTRKKEMAEGVGESRDGIFQEKGV